MNSPFPLLNLLHYCITPLTSDTEELSLRAGCCLFGFWIWKTEVHTEAVLTVLGSAIYPNLPWWGEREIATESGEQQEHSAVPHSRTRQEEAFEEGLRPNVYSLKEYRQPAQLLKLPRSQPQPSLLRRSHWVQIICHIKGEPPVSVPQMGSASSGQPCHRQSPTQQIRPEKSTFHLVCAQTESTAERTNASGLKALLPPKWQYNSTLDGVRHFKYIQDIGSNVENWKVKGKEVGRAEDHLALTESFWVCSKSEEKYSRDGEQIHMENYKGISRACRDAVWKAKLQLKL